MPKRYWSAEVTQHSNALDLQHDVFKQRDPKKIAASLKRSAEESRRRKSSPFRSAMSMLTFYINRAGHNLSKAQLAVLERAKEQLRIEFGVKGVPISMARKYNRKSSNKVQTAMHEMKQGTLKSGRSGRKVTNPKQAVAIGLSEAREEGDRVPPPPARKGTAGRKKAAAPRTAGTRKKAAAKKSAGRKKTATRTKASRKKPS